MCYTREEAIERLLKSFHFSLHGWMDYHAAVVELGCSRIDTNRSGHNMAKILKKVRYSKAKGRGT